MEISGRWCKQKYGILGGTQLNIKDWKCWVGQKVHLRFFPERTFWPTQQFTYKVMEWHLCGMNTTVPTTSIFLESHCLFCWTQFSFREYCFRQPQPINYSWLLRWSYKTYVSCASPTDLFIKLFLNSLQKYIVSNSYDFILFHYFILLLVLFFC